MMKNLRKIKSGISLIVLVITIIVMIILAAAIILSLSNSGIIGKANTGKTEYSLASIREKIGLELLEQKLNDNVSKENVESVLSKYGEVTYEDEGKSIIRGVKVKEYDKEILISEIAEEYALPKIEDFEYTFDFEMNAYHTVPNQGSLNGVGNIVTVSYKKDEIEMAWFTDSFSKKSLKLCYNNSIRENSNKTLDKLNFNTYASGQFSMRVTGSMAEWTNETLKWNKPIIKEIILENTSSEGMYGRYAVYLVGKDIEVSDNVQKCLKIRIKDENGNLIQEFSPREVFSGTTLVTGVIQSGETAKYTIEFELHFDI